MINRPLIIAIMLTAAVFAAVATTVAVASPLNTGLDKTNVADALTPLASEAASAAIPVAEKIFFFDKLSILSELPKRAVLAAKRLMAAIPPSPNVNAPVAAENSTSDNSPGAASETTTNATTENTATGTVVASTAAEPNKEKTEGIGRAFADFFRLAWVKSQPLISQGWNFFVSLLAGFFAGLWTPATNTNAVTDTVVNINAAATAPIDIAPTTPSN